VKVASLLGLDLRKIIEGIERRCGVKLPREVVEVYLDKECDLLFIRFREPRNVEVGEPFIPRCHSHHFMFVEFRELSPHPPPHWQHNHLWSGFNGHWG